jgi:hypothetical protein
VTDRKLERTQRVEGMARTLRSLKGEMPATPQPAQGRAGPSPTLLTHLLHCHLSLLLLTADPNAGKSLKWLCDAKAKGRE